MIEEIVRAQTAADEILRRNRIGAIVAAKPTELLVIVQGRVSVFDPLRRMITGWSIINYAPDLKSEQTLTDKVKTLLLGRRAPEALREVHINIQQLRRFEKA